MQIDSTLLRKYNFNVSDDISFEFLGLVNSVIPKTLTFLDDSKYIGSIILNDKITGVITTESLYSLLKETNNSHSVVGIICQEPRMKYYELYNALAKEHYVKKQSSIDPTASIHPTAFIAAENVIIGKNVVVGPNVSILEDVEIGDYTIVGANSVLGCENVEVKRTSKGFLKVFHDGKLIIGTNVDIGASCVIDKGFKNINTVIGDFTIVSNQCMISHGTKIGKYCLIIQSIICGSVNIEDEVRVSSGSVISNQVKIGKGAEIGIGSVVVKNVLDGTKVSGYYAIEHKRFLYNYVKAFGSI